MSGRLRYPRPRAELLEGRLRHSRPHYWFYDFGGSTEGFTTMAGRRV